MRKAHSVKQKVVEDLVDRFNRSSLAVFTDYRGNETGLSVDRMRELRQQVRESGGEVRVAKNTLLLRAMNQMGVPDMKDILVNPTAVVFAYEDSATTSRALVEFAKKTKNKFNPDGIPSIKVGYMDGAVIDAGMVKKLATLPSRELLLSHMLATMQAPISSFARVINAPLAGLVTALDAIREQKEEAAA